MLHPHAFNDLTDPPATNINSLTALRTAIDVLQSPACILDPDGTILQLNRTWAHLAGIPGVERRRTGWPALIHASDLDQVLERLQASLRDKHIDAFECRLRDRNGTPRWFNLSVQANEADPDDRDAHRHWLCVATDIQSIKDREVVLQQGTTMRSHMLDISMDCIKLITLQGNLVHMNRAGCLALGVAEDSKFGMPWLPLLPSDVHAEGEAALAQVRNGHNARFNGRSITADGAEQFWDNVLTPVLDADGGVTSILCVSREVTAEQQATRALHENMERLAIAIKVGGLGIWDFDIATNRLTCDESWYRIMGRDPQLSISSLEQFRPFIHPEDVDRATEVANTAAELIASDRDYSVTFRIVKPNGEVRWIRSLAYLDHKGGVPTRAVGYIADITDAWRGELALRDANRALEAERTALAREAQLDPLTGVGNRRYLDSEFRRLWLSANEVGLPLCVGMIDVDCFKDFNDRYGHLEGDTALRKIASVLQTATRQSDLLARYGGEEFIFVLSNTSEPTSAIERFIAAVAALNIPHAGSPNGRLTISCGVVVAQRASRSPTQLVRYSDEALYQAKQNGRNGYVLRVLEEN